MELGTVVAVLIAGLALLLNFVMAIRQGQWGLPDRLAKMESRLMAAVAGNKTDLDSEIDKIVSKLDDRDGTIRREFGETVRAMQQKISDIEKYVRDTFVQKDAFYQATADLKQTIQNQASAESTRLNRIEDKVDQITEHLLKS